MIGISGHHFDNSYIAAAEYIKIEKFINTFSHRSNGNNMQMFVIYRIAHEAFEDPYL